MRLSGVSLRISAFPTKSVSSISYSSFRNFSVQSRTYNTVGTDQVVLAEKPSFTGNGPFVELPKFNAIGNPSKLLNISLPQSSRLCIRHGFMVAIDGDPNQITSTEKWLTDTADYQELLSNEPVSLVINGNNKSYTVLEVDKSSDEWLIMDYDNIIAWTGFNFKLSPVDLYKQLSSFKTAGKGVIVINGDNQLFNVNVNAGEEVFVDPNTLIATTRKPRTKIMTKGKSLTLFKRYGTSKDENKNTTPVKFNLPRVGLVGGVVVSIEKKLKSLQNSITNVFDISSIRSNWSSVKTSLKPISRYVYIAYEYVKLLLVGNIIKRDPIFFRITGPAKILINTNTDKYGRIFTKREIEAIHRTGNMN
ncbi:predicted protein [Scheffersomyces stipitis CBS 6054]|uniref:Altered inheritance of mitochondria protein 24, mitochondrial n=1 Tax=Scheffersomyces stipitis (strain ATCC 58785 / CBS 6054 / NBRC 10063 / NRRL Y-11545) TaxID=322104 RepID=A3LTK2_PICST|nr:predicted protein [Scheffersomyces stipitis CBS 6054]ABN66424.2 predicted protein [Scheffersomyces stipitis CBS 6054]KAG2732820.1 hypothetical protein G9P44_003810 [Scheffersomyces stipitis]